MRAGTLSDARVIALLRRHFVCVHMPELCTAHLISDPEDLALLRRYHEECRAGDGWSRPDLFGGEREVFLTPAGELVDIFLSLNVGTREEQQHTPAARSKPDAAVAVFFKAAHKALRRTVAGVPDDFADLRDGTHADVAAAAAITAPAASPPRDGRQHVRVFVRNDLVMYESLVGESRWSLTDAQARALLPEAASTDATHAWPRAAFLALARAAYPRAAGVLLDLRDESITGELVTTVTQRDGDAVAGTFAGEVHLSASLPEERGRRETYRPFRSATLTLTGDFAFDAGSGKFLTLRLASTSGTGCFEHGPQTQHLPYAVAAELAR